MTEVGSGPAGGMAPSRPGTDGGGARPSTSDAARHEAYERAQQTFESTTARQQRAEALALTEDNAEDILHFCFHRLVQAAASGGVGSDDDTFASADAFDRWAPLMTTAQLREWADGTVLTRNLLRGAVMAEVADMVRVLGRQRGLPPAPMGALHTAHFAATVAALVSQPTMADLLRFFLRVCHRMPLKNQTAVGPALAGRVRDGLAVSVFTSWASLERRAAVRSTLEALAADIAGQVRSVAVCVTSLDTEDGLCSFLADPDATENGASSPPPAAAEMTGTIPLGQSSDSQPSKMAALRAGATSSSESSCGPASMKKEEAVNAVDEGIDEDFWRNLAS